ncbi:MAG: hypothetical protein ABFD89_05250 [Bryobacteraceae bacterium]
MKTRISFGRIAPIALWIATLALTAPAQTNSTDTLTAPTDTSSFFKTAISYVSSFNTNLDCTFTNRGSFWTGMDSIQGGSNPLANSIGVSYRVWNSVEAEGVMRDAGTAGSIVSAQGGLAVAFRIHDTRLSMYCDGGYGFGEDRDRVFCEPGFRVDKALTEHTYAGVGLGFQFPSERKILEVRAGFTF